MAQEWSMPCPFPGRFVRRGGQAGNIAASVASTRPPFFGLLRVRPSGKKQPAGLASIVIPSSHRSQIGGARAAVRYHTRAHFIAGLTSGLSVTDVFARLKLFYRKTPSPSRRPPGVPRACLPQAPRNSCAPGAWRAAARRRRRVSPHVDSCKRSSRDLVMDCEIWAPAPARALGLFRPPSGKCRRRLSCSSPTNGAQSHPRANEQNLTLASRSVRISQPASNSPGPRCSPACLA